jgi:hypothetical protein
MAWALAYRYRLLSLTGSTLLLTFCVTVTGLSIYYMAFGF